MVFGGDCHCECSLDTDGGGIAEVESSATDRSQCCLTDDVILSLANVGVLVGFKRVCVCVCVRAWMCVGMCMHEFIHACMHVCVCLCVCVCAYLISFSHNCSD